MCRFQGSGFVIVNENLFVTMASPLEVQKAFTGESAAAGMPTCASSAPFLLFECFVEMHIKRKQFVLVIILGLFNSWIIGTRFRRVNFDSDGTAPCRPECDETNGRNDVSEIGDERRMVQNVSFFCD